MNSFHVLVASVLLSLCVGPSLGIGKGSAQAAEPPQGESSQPTHQSPDASSLRVVLDDLDNPTDLILLDSADSNLAAPTLLIAEGGNGRLLAWNKHKPLTIINEGLTPGEIRVISAGDGSFASGTKKVVVAHSSLATLQKQGQQVVSKQLLVGWPKDWPVAESNPVTSFAISQHHLFALYNGKLMRSRRESARFTSLRLFENATMGIPSNDSNTPEPMAICFSEQNHLMVAQEDSGQIQLAYYDPYQHGQPALITVEGLQPGSQIKMLRHGRFPKPVSRRLYALVRAPNSKLNDLKINKTTKQDQQVKEDQQGPRVKEGVALNTPLSGLSGLYCLDAMAPVAGKLSCRASLVVPLDRPVAFAMVGDGSVYIIALTEQGRGVLLHAQGDF